MHNKQATLKSELDKLEELHQAKLLSEEQYEEAVKQMRKKYADEEMNERLGDIKDYLEKANKAAELASNFVTSLKEAETAQLEAEYQAQLTAAGDNAEEREAIEAEYEQKKLDLQKKYADTEMVINIAKAISAGALAAVESFAAAGNPILGAVFAAIVAATTALEVATIIKQRNAIRDKSKGITVLIYDKAAEIGNSSDKQYILSYYGNPKRLYRTEVHLNAEDIKNHVERIGIQYTPLILFDETVLESMFFHYLGSVIRFQSRKYDVSWEHLLGRS